MVSSLQVLLLVEECCIYATIYYTKAQLMVAADNRFCSSNSLQVAGFST